MLLQTIENNTIMLMGMSHILHIVLFDTSYVMSSPHPFIFARKYPLHHHTIVETTCTLVYIRAGVALRCILNGRDEELRRGGVP